jgi:hypothetical protein
MLTPFLEGNSVLHPPASNIDSVLTREHIQLKGAILHKVMFLTHENTER